jgi:hypothetical protein
MKFIIPCSIQRIKMDVPIVRDTLNERKYSYYRKYFIPDN